MFYGTANRSINSTQLGVVATPSTATLLAEIDFNSTMAAVDPRSSDVSVPYGVSWIVGSGSGSTITTFLLDLAHSTGVGTTAIREQTVAQVSSGASAQFYTQHDIRHGDRLRVRVASTVLSANAKIIAKAVF